MQLSLRTKILWQLKRLRFFVFAQPYFWRCPEKNCYFMVQTNDLTVMQQVRATHECSRIPED